MPQLPDRKDKMATPQPQPTDAAPVAVSHDGITYIVGRDYSDREGALWRITGDRDLRSRPLVFLLPEGAGEDVPLDEIVADFGPLDLHSKGCACTVHTDNDAWRIPVPAILDEEATSRDR